MRAGDEEGRERARQQVDAAKIALGERGPVWWTDGTPDLNRHMAKNTSYAVWFAALESCVCPAFPRGAELRTVFENLTQREQDGRVIGRL